MVATTPHSTPVREASDVASAARHASSGLGAKQSIIWSVDGRTIIVDMSPDRIGEIMRYISFELHSNMLNLH